MRTTLKTSGERVHIALAVALLAACAANLMLVWGWSVKNYSHVATVAKGLGLVN